MSMAYDVIVVGSGGAGLLAALRVADLGLSVIVVEKSHHYGGTSATSGGALWIPNHGLQGHIDSDEKAMAYLTEVTQGADQKRLCAYVENGRQMVSYLSDVGIRFEVVPGLPDYFSNAPGAVAGRALFPAEIDGSSLGDDYFTMRELPYAFKLFNRYSLDLAQSFALSARSFGWRWVAAKMFMKYWLDIPWRMKTRRDRRATMGVALVAGLRRELNRRGVQVLLNTGLEQLDVAGGRVVGVRLSSSRQLSYLRASRAVVLAAGGFEQNQAMRDRYMAVPTKANWSLTPPGANVGDAVRAGEAIGAATEFMECAWWAPSMQLPTRDVPNVDVTHQMFFDHRHPNSVCVNRLGFRFVNESCSYDRFGIAMIEDHRKTGANVPCWMVFDAAYRAKYTCGGIMPDSVMPDKKIPPDWWDNYLYRADTIGELAGKLGIDGARLATVIAEMNGYAATGVDLQFGRGKDVYDRYFGDARVRPNPCLAPINKPPYYAIRMDLGDLGTKGGLKADQYARVLDRHRDPIPGLYAAGNSSGSAFGNCYPGAGGTLGPALTFAYIAANDIAMRAGAAPHGSERPTSDQTHPQNMLASLHLRT
jgi:3-oxosteroid 1-dehydrogenase